MPDGHGPFGLAPKQTSPGEARAHPRPGACPVHRSPGAEGRAEPRLARPHPFALHRDTITRARCRGHGDGVLCSEHGCGAADPETLSFPEGLRPLPGGGCWDLGGTTRRIHPPPSVTSPGPVPVPPLPQNK